MQSARPDPIDTIPLPLPLPGWLQTAGAESLDQAAFLSGAALAHLHLAIGTDSVPQPLWRARLALTAAERCAGFAGRREGAAALRDALHLTRAGDHPGPAGEILRQWFDAVTRPISLTDWGKVLAPVPQARIESWHDSARGNPVEQAAAVLEAVLTTQPRAQTAALILADAALARAQRQSHLTPCLSLALSARDLRLRGPDLLLACHRALLTGVRQALPLAHDLARRAARLTAARPKLRAKGAGQAVVLFLNRDALAPGDLTRLMSDRAARRLCDRLVQMRLLRELTGRPAFRLYGL